MTDGEARMESWRAVVAEKGERAQERDGDNGHMTGCGQTTTRGLLRLGNGDLSVVRDPRGRLAETRTVYGTRSILQRPILSHPFNFPPVRHRPPTTTILLYPLPLLISSLETSQ